MVGRVHTVEVSVGLVLGLKKAPGRGSGGAGDRGESWGLASVELVPLKKTPWSMPLVRGAVVAAAVVLQIRVAACSRSGSCPPQRKIRCQEEEKMLLVSWTEAWHVV